MLWGLAKNGKPCPDQRVHGQPKQQQQHNQHIINFVNIVYSFPYLSVGAGALSSKPAISPTLVALAFIPTTEFVPFPSIFKIDWIKLILFHLETFPAIPIPHWLTILMRCRSTPCHPEKLPQILHPCLFSPSIVLEVSCPHLTLTLVWNSTPPARVECFCSSQTCSRQQTWLHETCCLQETNWWDH